MPLLGPATSASSKTDVRSYAASYIGYALFATRWLQAPLYFGLVAAQGVYVYKFFNELWHLIAHIMSGQADETHVMLAVLKLVDVVMIANLLIMVIVGGYETFVSRIGLQGHRDQPEWLSHVNSNVLKVKLATAIVGISSVHLLQMFVDVAHTSQHSLLWGTVIHMAFILSAAILAYMSGPMESHNRQDPGHDDGGDHGYGYGDDHGPDDGDARRRAHPRKTYGKRPTPADHTRPVEPVADGVPAPFAPSPWTVRQTGPDAPAAGGHPEDAHAVRPAAATRRNTIPPQGSSRDRADVPVPATAEDRLHAAGFPSRKTLEDFAGDQQRPQERKTIARLGTLGFVDDRANAVFLGPPGTGKTHLAVALGVRACRAGHGVLFATGAEWAARLAAARSAGRLTEEIARLDRYPVIVVDEIGYVSFTPDETQLLFRLVSHRYERTSVVVTSDKPFARWTEVFGDTPVTTALLDRLVHHAEVVTLQGGSYRTRGHDRPAAFHAEGR
ncbi:IS21-like element helper ATPase IstB [Streptomyces sp. NPDC059578]|uniref:IS21-like element helper ATPase IstB n=1 Tax=Streptomyces sp. NPDC059578 TaxID=3346874 RepID=UPI0036C2D98C